MSTIQYHPNIFPGLLDKRVEFFANDGDVTCFYDGKVLKYEDIPASIINQVKAHMKVNHHLVKDVAKCKLDFNGDLTKKYTYYIFGGLNMTPDIDLDGTVNPCDFFNCDEDVPMILSVNNGKSLSKREITILGNVSKVDKVNADMLFVSRETVLTHWQNVRIKTKLASKVELAIMAVKEGIL